ncbi:MAG: restriction endonuclease subunit S [Burkholderiales bacterium]
MTSIRALAEVADVFNGKTPSKAEQRSEGHPVLKIKDVSETGDFKGKFESFVEPTLATKHQARWVRSGDSLILNAAHNADYVASKMFFAGASVEGTLPTGEWLIVRAKPELVLPAYINFWLRSAGARKTIKFLVKGIHLYPKDVATLSVPVPLRSEQRRIVDLLSRAEGIVRLRREAQRKAAGLIPGIFLDMFGDPTTNPKGWPVLPLNDVSEVISGATKGRRLSADEAIELPYMRVANVKDGHLDLMDVKTIKVKRTEINRLKLEPGDLLMTEGGDPDKLGRAALWHGEIDLCVHQNHIFKVRSNRKIVLPEYLQALAGSTYGKNHFLRIAKKTTGIASINKTQLSAFPVVLSPIKAQEQFVKHVALIESIQSQQSAATFKAQATFDALLAQAFTQ